jgi:hypothetical protein
VRKNLDVDMIATVLQMPSSAFLVLRVKRRVKRRANNSKKSSPKMKISVTFVRIRTQRDYVCS